MRVLFAVFLFVYFFRFQSPLLELGQHQLSHGVTTYRPLISSLVLTGILMLVQHLVAKGFKFVESLYCFSYLPSALLAVLLTAFVPEMNLSVVIAIGVALLLFIIVALCTLKCNLIDVHRNESYAKLFTVHSVGMIGVLMFIGIFSNSNDVLTYEVQTAHHINAGDYEKALEAGNQSLATSPRLSALRAYAMARTDTGLGDRFFAYPLSNATAEQLLFAPEDTLQQILPPDSLYASFGVWRGQKEPVIRYFHRVIQRSDNPSAKDYLLTALLLKKDLLQFAAELRRFYVVADSVSLPKYYEQALSIYDQETGRPLAFKNDSVVIEAYQKFLDEGAQYDDELIRKNQLRRKYGDTYWWYYHYKN